MEMQWVKEFIVLAEAVKNENSGFTYAAEQLDTEVMKLSRHIRSLEKELGFSLFERTTRKVSLTESGNAFLPHAYDMSESMQKGIFEMSNIISHNQKVLRMGSVAPLGIGNIYTSALHKCIDSFPGCQIHISEFSNWTLKTMLRNGELDLIIGYHEINDDSDFMSINIEKDTLVAVVEKKHELSNESVISLKDLENENLIANPRSSFLGNIVHNACLSAGFKPKVVYSDNSNSNIAHVSDHGIGIGIMMRSSARYLLGPHSAMLSLEPETSMDLCVMFRKEHVLSDIAGALIDQLKDLKEENNNADQ